MTAATNLILGIESSCDETALALVENGKIVQKNLIFSQVDLHQQFGGVVPEVASRAHVEKFPLLLEEIKDAMKNITAVAVTQGPGLLGSLLIGQALAKTVSSVYNVPLIPINHLEGHIAAVYLENDIEPVYPFMAVVVSGGHTHIYFVKEFGSYELVGKTCDDAIGEVFDKIARYLNLGYPGGPIVDRMSTEGNVDAVQFPDVDFPKRKRKYDMSFSGLKTACIVAHRKNPTVKIEDLLASFQEHVMLYLARHTFDAAQEYDVGRIIVSGGVAANSRLKTLFADKGNELGIEFLSPELKYCTDNAAMIAGAGHWRMLQDDAFGVVEAAAGLKLEGLK
ncbi:tRNA (adenosine(37)-N6)-threonylcarbamoyltransferase complex transferase subunit TsaD [Candidatus Margulisiibacteriota bacterium]